MASMKFNNVYLGDSYSVASSLEAKGNLKNLDLVINDYYFGLKTFEGAEIKMQKIVVDYLLQNNNNIKLIVGGDLSNQLAITAFMASHYNISYLGMYSACATFNSAIISLASLIDLKKINKGIAITSSHNKVAERQFRYPIEYGAPKPKRTTYTATGSVGVIVTKEKTNIRVESATIGQSINSSIKDALNMGAVMAPAAANTLYNHLKELNIDIKYYDLILTGDLGIYGSKIFKELLNTKYNIKLNKHIDAGSILYKKEQNLYAGSSGPVTLPLVLFNKILKEKKYKKILLIATGSLHSPTLVNQKNPICATAHAIGLEVIK
ncbi:MAG: stage V sporulation protein AD [Bacilli bacterium]|nr:stage V sporulation protein AD [Bacilli bacterium]